MSYQIITDSGCDLPQEMLQKLSVTAVPLIVNFRGESLPDSVDEGIQDIYAGLRAGEAATTSAINPDGWARAMEPSLQAGQDVLVMTFSSGLSTTYQSAVIAAEELREEFPQRKLIVVDTLSAAIGQGLLVYTAAKLRSQGKSIEETAAWIEEHKLNICHWVTVEDLMHLKRGGRISAATAVVGTMLNIKPIIRVDNNGKLESLAKCRGRKAALNHLLDRMAESFDPEIDDTVFIGHGDCLEDAQYLESKIRERFGVKNVYINYIGAVVGSHTGPGVAVIFFYGKKR